MTEYTKPQGHIGVAGNPKYVDSEYPDAVPERFEGETLFDSILDNPFDNIGICVRLKYKTNSGGVASWKCFVVSTGKSDNNEYVDTILVSDGVRDLAIKRRELVMIEPDPQNPELKNRMRILEEGVSGLVSKVSQIEARLERIGGLLKDSY